jgi:hypothetical protein
MVPEPLKIERKALPPAFLAGIVEALTPRAHRDEMADFLLSNYPTLPRYCFGAMRHIGRTITTTAAEAFDSKRLFGDLACVFIAFHTVPVSAMAAVLVVAAVTLLLRDGHTHPPETSAGESATDAVAVGATLLTWQLLCVVTASSFTAPPLEFLLGLAFSTAMIAGWRLTLRWEKKPQISPSDAERAYRDAWRVYLLWMAAIVALQAGNTRVVVDPGFARDFFFGFGPWVPFVIAARLQSERIGGGLFDWLLISFSNDPQKLENAARATHLFSRRMKTWADFSPVNLFEGLFFLSLALEILSAPAGVFLGWTPVDTPNWFLLSVNAAAFITLSRIWIEVKKIHERVALALLTEVNDTQKSL